MRALAATAVLVSVFMGTKSYATQSKSASGEVAIFGCTIYSESISVFNYLGG